jgi:hypothetical protein
MNLNITREPMVAQVLKVFTDLKKLEDLHWPIFGLEFKAFIKNSLGAFHSIRRLVMKCKDFRHTVSLVAAYLICSKLINVAHIHSTPPQPRDINYDDCLDFGRYSYT